MESGYFKTCWNDIKETPGWFAKILLLGLVFLIPIFGQVVVLGYSYGWAREIAWNMKTPMPARIFANEDGRLFSRGFFVLVIAFVCSLVPSIIEAVWDAMAGRGLNTASEMMLGSGVHGVLPDLLLYLLIAALSVFALFFAWVGSMRSTIYCRLAPGFQVTRAWSMMRHDSRGLVRLLGMYVVLSIAAYAVVLVITLIIGLLFGGAALGVGLSEIGWGYTGSLNDLANSGNVALVVLCVLGTIFFALLLVYAVSCMAAFIIVIQSRALGYWTRQFDVPAWGGQDDPMPFEHIGSARG